MVRQLLALPLTTGAMEHHLESLEAFADDR
jgi:hypothetical protein